MLDQIVPSLSVLSVLEIKKKISRLFTNHYFIQIIERVDFI